MNVDGALANLLQGISQQPPAQRLPGQCAMQINAVNDVVDGWKRRPPTEFIANLLGVTSSLNLRWHFYDTGLEQYLLCIQPDGTLSIFDLLGNSYTAAGASANKSVLSFTSPEDISLVTIGDYTIIANSKTVPAMLTTGAEVNTNTALVYLKDGGEYGRKYTVVLDGLICASYTTPGGSNAGVDAKLTGTEYVAKRLYLQLTTGASGVLATAQAEESAQRSVVNAAEDAVKAQNDVSPNTAGSLMDIYDRELEKMYALQEKVKLLLYPDAPVEAVKALYTFKLAGSIIEITRKTGTDVIAVEATDDRGGQFSKVIQRTAEKPGDLPKFATPGQIIQITGEGSSEKDDYYLKFTIEDGTQAFGTEGVWRECCAPGLTRMLDSATMPHALIRMPDSSWLFTPIDGSVSGSLTIEHWRYRSSGDDDTNKVPSFVGKPICFMGTFQDRLFVLSDETCIFSATSSYFNFFNKTAVTILDSDPIDMPSAGNSIVKLKRAVQHDKNLVIFSDKAQFVVPGTAALTPKSSMVLTTSYESDLVSTPVIAGTGVLFPITYGNYAGVREFITASANDTNSSQPITAHVPKLLAGSIKHMQTSSNFDTVVIQSSAEPAKVYVYKYLWQDGERKQASWGVWEFSEDVATMFIKGSCVYFVIQGRLEKLDLTDVPPGTMPYNVFLDARVLLTPVNGIITLPYSSSSALAVVQGPTCAYPGASVKFTAVGTEVTLSDAVTAPCYVGFRIPTSYTPTLPVIKDQNGGQVNNANFILGKVRVSYKNTGSFDVRVLNSHYPEYLAHYSGRTIGALANMVGAPSIDTGVFEVPVRKDCKSTTLVFETSSHLPMNLTAIEWDGDYTKKGRRL